MDLIIRCTWMYQASTELSQRRAGLIGCLEQLQVLGGASSLWHFPANSEKASLASKVQLVELRDESLWRRVTLPPDEAYSTVTVWNGADERQSGGISVYLYCPQTQVDQLVISTPDHSVLMEAGRTWQELLDDCRFLSRELGGHVIISSHELWEEGEARGIRNVCYAAFWSSDVSGQNPAFQEIVARKLTLPHERVACASWQEITAPDWNTLKSVAALIP